jgi:hypothetical protein
MREIAQILAFFTSMAFLIHGLWVGNSSEMQHGAILLAVCILWVETK